MSLLDAFFGTAPRRDTTPIPANIGNDVRNVYNMLSPKPRPLLYRNRTLVRHGQLIYFSPNTMSKKPRYFFLFNDCLLVTKRKAQQKFRLRIFIHLRSNVRLVDKEHSLEFRLLIPVYHGRQGRPAWRNVIMYARDMEHKRGWIRDLKHCLWIGSGRIGPDPSGIVPYTGPQLSAEEMERMRMDYLRREEEEARRLGMDGDMFGSSGDEGDSRSSAGSEHGAGYASKQKPAGMGGVPPQQDPYAVHTKPSAAGSDPFMSAYGAQDPSRGSGNLIDFNPGMAGAARAGQADVASAWASYDQAHQQASTAGLATAGLGADPYGLYAAGGVGASAAGGYDRSQLGMAAMGTGAAVKGMVGTTAAPEESFGEDEEAVVGLSVMPDVSQQREKELNDGMEKMAAAELAKASAAIEEIARKLAARPRRAPEPVSGAPVTMDEVSDALMDGTAAITKAAQALLLAATAAQNQRVQKGLISAGGSYHADPQWANGLISAAVNVVSCLKHLVSTADAVANGKEAGEALIASARAVTGATTQLVTAHRAKADMNSESSKQLEEAAKRINSAAKALVDQAAAASAAANAPAKSAPATEDYALPASKKAEIEMQAKYLKLQAEAERAREELAAMRKQQYQH